MNLNFSVFYPTFFLIIGVTNDEDHNQHIGSRIQFTDSSPESVTGRLSPPTRQAGVKYFSAASNLLQSLFLTISKQFLSNKLIRTQTDAK
jgi:hypothetical protein